MEAGLLTREQLEQALAVQEQQGGRLGVILNQMGAIDSKTLAHYLSLQTQATISRIKAR